MIEMNRTNSISPDIIEKTISSDSLESPSIIQGLVFIAKNLLENFRNKKLRISSEINKHPLQAKIPRSGTDVDVEGYKAKNPYDQTSHGDLHHHVKLVVEDRRPSVQNQKKTMVRRASDSKIITKPNSPLYSEYEKNKSNNSSYKFICRNMNRELAEAVGVSFHSLSESDKIKHEKWIQPKKHGLENSPRIIPDYYMGTNMRNKVLTIDYHYMILDDIRNLRPLNKAQLEYIDNELNETQKHEIIVEFNSVIKMYCLANS